MASSGVPYGPCPIFQAKLTTHFTHVFRLLCVKKNVVCLLIHDPNGGGFNNVAAVKLRRLGRQARRTGVDRTKYAGRRQISFVTHHSQQITAGVVRNEAINSEIAANKIKGDLYKSKNGLERGA